jgi:hypothetical protein
LPVRFVQLPAGAPSNHVTLFPLDAPSAPAAPPSVAALVVEMGMTQPGSSAKLAAAAEIKSRHVMFVCAKRDDPMPASREHTMAFGKIHRASGAPRRAPSSRSPTGRATRGYLI